MTQQNAAMVEESAAAALSMQEHAGHLMRTVGAFRLDEGAAGRGGPQGRERMGEPAALAAMGLPLAVEPPRLAAD